MKPYERRAAGCPLYFKLATWDAVRVTWVDGKTQYATGGDAHAAAHAAGPGTYRISVVDGRKRFDGPGFTVSEKI